ncbi:uncharacterized protein LOC111633907 [Centruroides sculpturatus]|uniref:uncharacterized protein LOC111633907 n=1 Tax=Centruroides sculpturatus TaxID=218467 RepID=UPI000C6E14E0|nr:uncharacterized protein LOC111633907 [Centruroides sculpturatus]
MEDISASFRIYAFPFEFQHITYKVIKRVILATWMLALVLVCLPLMGFGLYYDGQATDGRPVCVRYRFARSAKDVAYAYLMLGFGLSLCLIMAGCNLAVVRVLCRIGAKKWEAGAGRTVVRKESNELAFDHVTAEEVAFAKLMIVFCIFFVVCWLPQMCGVIAFRFVSDDHRKEDNNLAVVVYSNTKRVIRD